MPMEQIRDTAAHGDALEAIKTIRDLEEELRMLLIGTVGRARGEGRTWGEIGAALGVTEQAARQRFFRRVA